MLLLVRARGVNMRTFLGTGLLLAASEMAKADPLLPYLTKLSDWIMTLDVGSLSPLFVPRCRCMISISA